MSQDKAAALTRCLQELRLAAVRSQYEAVARQATAEAWGYTEFLLELMQRECQQRQHHRIEQLRELHCRANGRRHDSLF